MRVCNLIPDSKLKPLSPTYIKQKREGVSGETGNPQGHPNPYGAPPLPSLSLPRLTKFSDFKSSKCAKEKKHNKIMMKCGINLTFRYQSWYNISGR